MSNLLASILAQKEKEIHDLPKMISVSRKRNYNFINAILNNGIIAEIKPKSPSQGDIIPRSKVPKYVKMYDESAQAISVLCDFKFFGGGFELLSEVRKLTNKPLLAKEFILSKKQILQAKHHGADAILLIASILEASTIASLAKYATYYGLDVLIEVHNKIDCDKVILAFNNLPNPVTNHIIIGINNRDLDTLEINIKITKKFAPYLRKNITNLRGIISESGISSPVETQALSKYVNGYLIGTSILKSKNPSEYIMSLRPKKVKFCGFTRKEDIKIAEDLGVDYLGFIFVPESPRYLTFNQAKKLRGYVKRASVVGVFGEMPMKDIKKYAKELRLDFIQLHGEPNIKKVRQISKKAIQVFQGVPKLSVAEDYLKFSQFILIDKAKGERSVDITKIAKFPYSVRSKMFIAGGLQPSNVKNVVHITQPYAVDCASGIEAKNPGKKCSKTMTSFIHNLQK